MTTSRNAKPIDAVTEALGARTVATTSELAEVTGLGRSTVGKVLVALESEGRATRSAGNRESGRRAADVWSTATVTEKPAEGVQSLPTDESAAPADRLGKGALRALVLGHMTANAGESFTPSAVGKTLHRSSGAVSNALARLAAEGDIAKVGDKPRRYAFVDA